MDKRLAAWGVALSIVVFGMFGINGHANEIKNHEKQIGQYYEVGEDGSLEANPRLEAGQTAHHYGETGEVLRDGDVIVDKLISPYGEENEFQIDLVVTTKEKVKEPDMAVAFVVDVSTSMDAWYNTAKNQTRIEAAQDAMKQFVEQFGDVSTDAKREIAITKFYVDAFTVTEWIDVTTDSGKQQINRYIDSLSEGVGTQSGSTANNWGTNIEGGLLLGRNLISKQSISEKHVILLSDGGANACVLDRTEGDFKSSSSAEAPVRYDTTNFNATSYEGSWYNSNYHFYHEGARESSVRIKNEGAQLHTVYCGNLSDILTAGDSNANGKLTGGDSCQYCVAAKAAFAAGNTSLDYKVTDFLENISDEFVAATNSEDLLGNIMQIAKDMGTAWVVTDPIPMGNHIEFIGFSQNQNVQTESGDGFAYNDAKGSISWDLKAVKNPKVITDSLESENPIYRYQLSYYVRLDNVYKGFYEELWHNTNNTTSVSYCVSKTGQNGKINSFEGMAYFNIPSVKGYAADYEFLKLGQKYAGSEETEGLAGAAFLLNHSNQCDCGISLDDSGWKMTAVSTSTGKVQFHNIPSGHRYELRETEAPEGYRRNKEVHAFTVSYGEIVDENGAFFADRDNREVINEKILTTNIAGSKIWDDNENALGKRPKSITVRLLADGTEVANKVVTKDDDWKWEFENVPVNQESGETIKYSITEDPVPGYTSVVNGYNITNTHVTEKISVSGKKTWDDEDNQDGIRPASIVIQLMANGDVVDRQSVAEDADGNWVWNFTDLDKYSDGTEITYTIAENEVTGYTSILDGYNITNKHTPEKTVVDVTKIWEDNNNQDGVRPASVTIKLLANGQDTGKILILNENCQWKGSFAELDKYADGKTINYTVEELFVEDYNPAGKPLITGTANIGYRVINRHEPEKVTVSGKKTWDDGDNRDGIRPESITIRLLADNVEVDSKQVKASDDWSWKFENLDKYKAGEEIVYTITEDEVPSYTSIVNGYNVTNSYTPEVTESTVQKVWDDADDQDRVRPDHLDVTLSNGTKVTLNEANQWSATVTDLPKNKDGKEIVYTWSEDEMPEGYVLSNRLKKGTVTTLTNSYTPKTTTATVKKDWDDANNQDGKRPENLKVTLSDGKEVILNEANGWTASVTELPKYKNGEEIVYTWSENEIPEGYKLKESSKVGVVTTLTNTYTPEKITISGKKTWDDKDNQDGIRPLSIMVHLNGTIEVEGEKKTVYSENRSVAEPDDWSWEFSEIPKYSDGQEITYTLSENAVAGYETVIEGYHITNKYIPAVKEDPKDKKPSKDEPEVDEEEKAEASEVIVSVEKSENEITDTGDSNGVIKYLCTISLAAAMFVVMRHFRRKDNHS